MCDDIQDFALFALHPMSTKTTNIVHFNQDCGNVPFGAKYFVVMAKQMARHKKGMVTFGREQDNDVWYKLGYNRHLCTFTLTSSGDVVFLDNSGINNRPMAGLVATTTDGQQKHVINMYSMSIEPEFGGCAQQRRVVPMSTGLDLRVEIGRGCSFALQWCVPIASRADVARTRALLARIYAAHPQQYYIEDPHSNTPYAQAQQALHERRPPDTHWYGSLWRDAPGRTHEAIDLRSGRVYAVKRLIGPQRPNGEDDLSAQQEWKRLARLQAMGFHTLEHPNIQPPQFMDGLADGHAWLDFYHYLYRGNARDHFAPLVALAGSHSTGVRSRMGRFAAQMLAALGYLDNHGVIHGNIKPENILYQTACHRPHPAMPARELVRFFLVDFAFGAAETHIGTPGYMAPETVRYYTRSGKTDLYALGVSMLELLGVLTVAEFPRGVRYWSLRLAALTGKAVLEVGGDDGCEYGHRQVKLLCEHGVLSPALEGMVRLQSDKRQDIQGTRQAFAELGDDAFLFGRQDNIDV